MEWSRHDPLNVHTQSISSVRPPNVSRQGLSTQMFFEFLGRKGMAEVIALANVAFEEPQNLPLLLGLDAFGNGPESKAVRHGDDGCDERRNIRIHSHLSYE